MNRIPPLRPFLRTAPPVPRRLYSSSPPPTPPSAHAAFYKTFGRPIAKVALGAIFTYQVVYYAWVRLEHNEVKVDLNATIAELETRVAELEAGKKP